MPVISTLPIFGSKRKLLSFEDSMGYIISPCHKKKNLVCETGSQYPLFKTKPETEQNFGVSSPTHI